jgi:4a-hydroxytetrahydrobiopterin dehydratase
MGDLRDSCAACRGEMPPLTAPDIARRASALPDGWQVIEAHHLEKEYAFPDFARALAFTNRVGALAEEEGHHPDIHLSWGRVRLVIWTFAVNGLTETDFVLAAKADRLLALS